LFSALVEHEWSFYHPEEDGKLPKLRSRPTEYEDWMKEHLLMRDFRISSDFGGELLQWWKDLGPPKRWVDVGDAEGQRKEPSRVSSDWWLLDWNKLHKRGWNGVVLLILGLAWWGQSICNAAAGDGLGAGEAALDANTVWKFMVDDIEWALQDTLTQGRTGTETLVAREAQEARGEVEVKALKKGSAMGKGKKAKTVAPQKEKAASTGNKR
jgi:hypothetical protein